MIKRRIFTKLWVQFGRHFQQSGSALSSQWDVFFCAKFQFRRRKRNRFFLPKRVSSAVMFSTFGSGSCEEVHYCGKQFPRQWRYGVFSAAEKSRQIDVKEANSSQRLGKNKSIFSLISRTVRHFQMAKRNILYKFFFQMCRSCSPSSLIRHSQSSR